jgi:acyl transferase domain-containing protein
MDLVSQRAALGSQAQPGRPPYGAPELAVLFPGQGAQHGRMAAGLYDHDPAFTAAVDSVFAALGRDGATLRADWLTGDPADPISEITRSQPLLLAICYGLGRMLLSWGVRPAALLGHSIGEIVAATLAEVFTVDDAATMVWGRITSLARAPRGGMLAVAASEAELLPYLAGTGVTVGAVNAPGQTVLSGLAEPLTEVGDLLLRDRFRCRPVPSNTGLHNPVLAPFAGVASQVFAQIKMRPATVSVYSCYTCAPLTPQQATSADFWISQPLSTVRFWPALDALLGQGDFLVIEAGPGRGLSALARRHPAVRSGRCTLAQVLPAYHQGAGADQQSAATVHELLRSRGLCQASELAPPGSSGYQPGPVPALAVPGQLAG